jgi:hypothetical protein
MTCGNSYGKFSNPPYYTELPRSRHLGIITEVMYVLEFCTLNKIVCFSYDRAVRHNVAQIILHPLQHDVKTAWFMAETQLSLLTTASQLPSVYQLEHLFLVRLSLGIVLKIINLHVRFK